MYESLKESLKSVDAEYDKDFQTHLLETKYLKRLGTGSCDIIYGKKGSGKTALRRALTEFKSDRYFGTITIALEQTSFESIYSGLAGLNSTVKLETHNIAKATWKNIFLNYALLAFINELPIENPLHGKIEKILKEENFIRKEEASDSENNNYRLMNTLERFFIKIIQLPLPKEKTLIGVTAEQQDVINHFPFNKKIGDLLDEVITYILENGAKKLLVCIDGFDTIIKHSPDSREAIFAGLIDAVFFFDTHKKLSEIIAIKAFLPYELTLEAHRVTWDSDKHLHNVHYISWEDSDFKLFIEKRFFPFSKKKYSKFQDVWNEFLPEKITNTAHSVDEITFDYILRHTMYRPRQVLNHVYKIISLWEETSSSNDKIQPSFIPPIIAKSNIEMADLIAKNLTLIYPNIIPFLKSWSGSQTIIEAPKFKEKIIRYLVTDKENDDFSQADAIFDQLFSFGIFGVKSRKTMSANSKKMEFHFAFVGDTPDSAISNSIDDSDITAFSPMFREYCGCLSTMDAIIIPIGLDTL